MTSELRPAVEVFRDANIAFNKAWENTKGSAERVDPSNKAAAAVIEADREAVRAPLLAEIERLTIQLEVESEPSPYCPICGSCGEDGCCGPQRCLYPTTEQAAELAKFKALAETLAGKIELFRTMLDDPAYDFGEAVEEFLSAAEPALRKYKEATNV